MMGTEIFKIDAPWAEKLTKIRVQFLMAPTVLLATVDARNAVNNIVGKTIHWSIYFYMEFCCKGFHILSWDRVGACHARDVGALLVASLGSGRGSCVWWWDFSFHHQISHISWSLISY